MLPYYSFNRYLREKFGGKVRRISLNSGFTCPNRDGTMSRDGCVFCNDAGFSPVAGTKLSLRQQINGSMARLRRHYKVNKFIAYFQNATNTYAGTAVLKEAFDTIKGFPDIVGLFISTRPDCIDAGKLALIDSYADRYDVWIEYGLQSAHDATLKALGRGHTFKDFADAVENTARCRIKSAAHIIIGLPGETKGILHETAGRIAALPVAGLKLHVLHVLKETRLEEIHRNKAVSLLSQKEYVSLACDLLERTRPECVIFRLVSDARPDILIAPAWINRKQQVIRAIEEEFARRRTCQGFFFA